MYKIPNEEEVRKFRKKHCSNQNYTCNHMWESRYKSWSPQTKPRKIFFSL